MKQKESNNMLYFNMNETTVISRKKYKKTKFSIVKAGWCFWLNSFAFYKQLYF